MSLTDPPGITLPIQWNTAVPHVNASPAMRAPPGRRMPNVTARANQNRPTAGGAVELLTWKLNSPSSTPPSPAIPAENANIRIFVRLTRMPDASAATSLERTARIARPDADRWNAWIAAVSTPKTMRNRSICSESKLVSIFDWCPTVTRLLSWLTPGIDRVGWRIVDPASPWRSELVGKITSDQNMANANVPRASETPPSFVIGNASNAPTRAAATTPMTIAHTKLSWPCVAISGMLTPQLWVRAHPAAKPPTGT